MQKLHPSVKKLLWVLLSFILLIVVVLAVMPYGIKWTAVYWLEQQGLEASIEKVDIDYNDGVLNIVNARASNVTGKGFAIEHFHFDIAWKPLLDRTAEIENIKLSGFKLDIEQDGEAGMSIAGIVLPVSNETNSSPEEQAESSEAWKIKLGNVLLNNIKSCYELKNQNKHYCVILGDFDWQGSLSFDANKTTETQPEINSLLKINKLSVNDERRQLNLLSINSIALDKLQLNGINDIKLDEFLLHKLVMLSIKESIQPAHNIAQLDSIQINQLQLSDQQRLGIQKILIKGAGASIYRDKQAQWEAIQQIDQIIVEHDKKDRRSSDPESEQSGASPLTIKIAEFKLLDSQQISFSDHSLATPFNISMIIKELSLSDIDTANKKQSSKLKLHLLTDKHGSIDLTGNIQLLADVRNFDLKGKIIGIDLRPVGSYLESGLGHRIKSGQLNADLNLVSRQGKMDSSLDLDLKQFKLRALTDEEQEKLQQKLALGMPLDIALNLLRDRDNSIKLKLPITGDVNQPDFNPSDAIYKATSSAMTVAIINYYTPFGLVHVAQGLFDLATALRFDPVEFEAGMSNISSAQSRSLDKIALLMTERPMLHLTLCGFSGNDDLAMISPELHQLLKEKPENIKLDDATKKRLLDVASKRSEAVKSYLVEKGVAADRLILCEPEFDIAGLARVELSI